MYHQICADILYIWVVDQKKRRRKEETNCIYEPACCAAGKKVTYKGMEKVPNKWNLMLSNCHPGLPPLH